MIRIILILLLFISVEALAFTVKLRWTANSPAENVKEYRLYNSTTKVRYTNLSSIRFINKTTVVTEIKDLSGSHSIHATAFDGVFESGPSTTVSIKGPEQIKGIAITK